MNPFAPTLGLGLFLLGAGCVSTAPASPPAFSFQVDGATYAIVAERAASQLVNDLVQVDGPRVLLRVRDLDRDGTLDTLLVGTVPLEDADAIYRHGIEVARARGVARDREPSRMYVMDGIVVWSVADGGSGWSNRIVRYSPAGQPGPTYTDSDADGRLDGEASPRDQLDYERILDAGVREGRVERVDGRLRVRARPAEEM